jgi:hypothetical protein
MDAEKTKREIDRIIGDAVAQIHALLESNAHTAPKPSPPESDRLLNAEES